MIDFTDISNIVADSFFNGDVQLAGLVLFSMVLAVMLSISRNIYATLILSLPVALVFSSMGLIGEDMLILLIVVIVLGLAFASRTIWSR